LIDQEQLAGFVVI